MLSALPKPHYEAQVSPALIRLRRAGVAMAGNSATSGTKSAEREFQRGGAAQVHLAPPRSNVQPVILRQDGRRPRIVTGGLVVEHVAVLKCNQASAFSVTRSLRLYLGSDGLLTCQVHIEPGPDTPLRPVWCVADVASVEDLGRLLCRAAHAVSAIAGADVAAEIKELSDDVRALHPSFFSHP